jgi:eukaryotic-like serine/threonine-protein kinase
MVRRKLLAKLTSPASVEACPSEAVIVDLVERRLDDGAIAALHDHVDKCAACRALLAGLAPIAAEIGLSATTPGNKLPADATPQREPSEAAGSEPAPAVRRTPGMVIGGRYRLDRLLGSGGMGVVWAAVHLVTRRHVALKFVRVLDDARPELRRRLLREGRAASAIDHPHVVRIHDVFEVDGVPVLVMDLLAGESLAQLRARREALPLDETVGILRPVVSALAAAHMAGVVHRDLKPENIFLAARPEGGLDVRVVDFGVAKLLETASSGGKTGPLTRTGEVIGTPFYMSPEQFFGEPNIDHRADIWALGVVLYECLAGQRPFVGDNFGQILKSATTGAYVPLSRLAPHLPREVTALAGQMLSPDPARRPSIDLIAAVLDRHTDGARGGRPRFRDMHRVRAGAVAAALVAAALAGAALLRTRARHDAPLPPLPEVIEPDGIASPEVVEPDGIVGTWYLRAKGFPISTSFERVAGELRGTLVDEVGGTAPLADVTWDAGSRTLAFYRYTYKQLFRGQVVDGVFVGRFADMHNVVHPDWPKGYNAHVTGWNEKVVERDLVPRVWEVVVGEDHGRLRIDRAPDGPFVGRFKIYAGGPKGAASGEQLEQDVDVVRWDGVSLEFVTHPPEGPRRFQATSSGRDLEGTSSAGESEPVTFTGARAEVLSHGFVVRSKAEREAWQAQTRRRLEHLLMARNPAPLSRDVVVLGERAPIEGAPAPERDDDQRPGASYRLRELRFSWTLPNPYGGPPLTRDAHGYLAVPSPLPEGVRFPAALALNGHGGSAFQVMSPGGTSWYGDSLARHGFVVLALDVSHRDDSALYKASKGDDPRRGNGPHRSLRAVGVENSDFEEDGERAWDAMRAIDWLIEQPFVDPRRILATGLSLGGEVATLVSALDPRVALTLTAGFAPDLGVLLDNGSHPCFRWEHGDVREYIDEADLQALIAPRALVVETGRADRSLSRWGAAMDKQVARRARVAWGAETDRYVHYLHDGGARFRVGSVALAGGETGVRTPVAVEPAEPWSIAWQTDSATALRAPSVYALIEQLMP